MPPVRTRGPTSAATDEPIDSGTMCLSSSPRRGPLQGANGDRSRFEQEMRALEVEIGNIGAHLTIDAAARQAYETQVRAMAAELRSLAERNQITWAEAATKANEARNTVMELIRSRSTPVGRALAEMLKKEGRNLNELIARKTIQLHGPKAMFDRLSEAERNAVYAEIVQSAGRANQRVSATMRNLSRAGRSLLFLSIALSVYTVATADDPATAAVRETTTLGAGIAGGIAGGALAGLACGPGAPVCVTIGGFIGGAAAAYGMDSLW